MSTEKRLNLQKTCNWLDKRDFCVAVLRRSVQYLAVLREWAGENLRRELLRQGKDKAWLAKAIRVDPATVSRMLQGRSWKLDYVDRCSEALNINPLALLCDPNASPDVRPDIIELWHAMSRLSHADVVALVAMANGMTRRRPLDTAVDVRYKDGQK